MHLWEPKGRTSWGNYFFGGKAPEKGRFAASFMHWTQSGRQRHAVHWRWMKGPAGHRAGDSQGLEGKVEHSLWRPQGQAPAANEHSQRRGRERTRRGAQACSGLQACPQGLRKVTLTFGRNVISEAKTRRAGSLRVKTHLFRGGCRPGA